MEKRKYDFLVAVLGDDGARALAKATERSEALGNVLVPRTIMAWLGITGRGNYEGDIPGIQNSYVKFVKSTAGDCYSGSIGIGDDVYTFDGEGVIHVAGAVAVALGVEHERPRPDLRGIDLVRLGKSIDLLVKARAVTEALGKDPEEESTEKAEAPGPAAAPLAQKPAQGPTGPQLQVGKGPTAKKPKLPKAPGMVKMLKITKTQSERKCSLCGLPQFARAQFRGCLCLRDLAKNVHAVADGDGFKLELGAHLDDESRETLLESLGSP